MADLAECKEPFYVGLHPIPFGVGYFVGGTVECDVALEDGFHQRELPVLVGEISVSEVGADCVH